MPSKLTAPFLLFGVALLLWSAAAGLSAVLAGGGKGAAAGHPQAGASQAPDSAAVKAARAKAEANPQAVEARLELAGALHEEAVEKRDNALLMDAVSTYQDVLEMNPENPHALLGLANLCFEAGILDKAIAYFERYNAKVPDDFRAQTDFALALIQSSMFDRAETALESVIKKRPSLYQAHLALALSWKLQGKVAEAEKKAEEAKKLAPTDEDRKRIDGFLKAMSEQGTAVQPVEKAENVSPAGQVAAFFESHPIVGPKLRGISWPELNTAKVVLENFPVEQMPPFAREKFIGGMKEKLKNLPDKVQVKLYDAATDRELLSVEVGGHK